MNKTCGAGSKPAAASQAALLLTCLFSLTTALAAEDARQIVAESQRRGRADSQRYEGSLEVISANNKVSKKHWQSDRLGS